MQVQSSYTSAFYANSKGIKSEPPPTAPSAAVQQTQVELEEMLGHLRADPTIGSRISDNDDGTYSFDMTAGGWSEKAFVASAIVTELNGGRYDTTNSGDHLQPTQGDTQLFKQITGYHLLMLGGEITVLDRNGYPPASSDQHLVQQAYELVGDIARSRALGHLDGELTLDNVSSFLSNDRFSKASQDLIRPLMAALRERAGTDMPPLSDPAPPPQGNEIAALLSMISV